MTHRPRPPRVAAFGTALALGAALALSGGCAVLAQSAPAPAVQMRALEIVTPTAQNVGPYGTLLGATPYPAGGGQVKSQRQGLFSPGDKGTVEVVWVEYNNAAPLISRLEKHYLTEQAVAPLKGEIIQVLALSKPDGSPDPATLRAFRLAPGLGINMGQGVWHTTRSHGSTVLMLSRSSTTDDILRARGDGKPLIETLMVDVPPVSLPAAF